MSKNSKLPSVTSDIPKDLRMFLDRVRETLADGVVSEDRVKGIIRGPGGGGGPGDDPVDRPTTPIGLFAIGQPGAISVQWEPATYRGHNHTEVWASVVDDIRQAEAVGMAPGASYIHPVGSEIGRYYWIRFVNRLGEAGPYNGEAGLYARSLEIEFPEPPVRELDESLLTRLLNERLAWLEDPTFGLRGEAARIRGEFNALMDGTIQSILDDLSEIRGELDDILVTEVFDETKAYAVGDLVIWLNPTTGTTFIYQCKLATTPPSPLPSNTTYWNQVGDYAAIQAIVDDLASASLQLQARGLLNEDGEVIGSIAAALLDVRSTLEDENGNLIDAEALLGLTGRVEAVEGKITALATALLSAGVILQQPDGTYIVSQAFLTLLARIETQTSNLLANAEWMQQDTNTNTLPDGWVRAQLSTPTVGTNFSERTSPFSSDGVRALYVRSDNALSGAEQVDIVQERVAAVEGGLYQASVYAGSVSGSGKLQVIIQFRDAHDAPVGTASFGTLTTLTKSGRDDVSPFLGTTLSDYQRVHVFSAAAPDNTAFARVIFRISAGTVNPLQFYMTRPFFGVAASGQTEPSPWAPGMQSNAFKAAAAAALALDTQYRSPDGPFASSTAFLQLKTAVEDDESGLAAIGAIALGIKSDLTDEDGNALTAEAFDSLATEVRSGPNNLTLLAQRLSAVSATLSRSGNIAKDVGFTTVGLADAAKRQWAQVANSGWAAATFGTNLNADYTVGGISEKVAYIRFVGTPAAGIAQISQEFSKPVALQWYQFSCWMQAHRCRGSIWMLFLDGAGATLKSKTVNISDRFGNGTTLGGYERLFVADQAPAGTTKITYIIRADAATGANPYVFAVRPLFGEAVADQAEPSVFLAPVADAFAFDEMKAEITDDETGLTASASKITGVTNFLVGPGGSLAESGAFLALRSTVGRIGSNVIVDAAFQAKVPSADGWTTGGNGEFVALAITADSPDAWRRLTTDAERTVLIKKDGAMTSGTWGYIDSRRLPVVPGKRYQASAYLAPFIVDGRVVIIWFTAGDAPLHSTPSNIIPSGGFAAGPSLTNWARPAVFDTAPATAAYAIVRIQATSTGGSNGRLFVVRPHFGVASADQTEPSDWAPGTMTASSELLQAVDAAITTGSPPTRFSAAAYQVFKASVDGEGGLASIVRGMQAGIGRGGNMIADSTFEAPYGVSWRFETVNQLVDGVDLNPWRIGVNLNDAFTLESNGEERTAYLNRPGTVPTSWNYYGDIVQDDIPIEGLKRYQVSAYIGVHRGRGRVIVEFFNASGAKLSGFTTNAIVQTGTAPYGGGKNLAGYARVFGFGVAPEYSVRARVRIRLDYSGIGTQTNAYLFAVRPFFGGATEDQTEPSPWAIGMNPPIFAALKEEGLVWADAEGEGSAGAIYTMKLRAKDNTGEANVGFGMGALKENGKWVADVRFSSNRFAIMDPITDVDQDKTARPWATEKEYFVGDVVSYHVQGNPEVSGVFRCITRHISGLSPNPLYWTRIGTYPFIVSDGIVYMNTAVIRHASIKTLMLDGNAVTVPSYIENSTNVSIGNNNWINLTEVAAPIINPMSENLNVLVQFSARQDYTYVTPDVMGPGTGFGILQTNNGGTPYVISSPAGHFGLTLCIAYNDYLVWSCKAVVPPNSVAWFTPQWFGADDTVRLRQKSLLLLGVKR